MEPEVVSSICRRVESISFYPICCFTEEYILYPSAQKAVHSALVYDPYFLRRLLVMDGIIQDSAFPDVFYYICHFEQTITLIMGPFSSKAAHKDIQKNYCRIHRIPASMPIRKADRAQVMDAAALISALFHSHGIYEAAPLAASEVPVPAENSPPAESPKLVNLIEPYPSLPRAPYELEKELLESLKHDDQERFWDALQRMSEYQTGTYASTAAKHSEYGAVMMVSAMTRAVIDGGVPSEDAYELSDKILYDLSLIHDSVEYDSITQHAFTQFLTLSHRYHGGQNISPHIRRCQSYIAHHLNQELTPDILASHLGLTRDYLLHLFTQAVGKPLMRYIQQQRIEAAKNMLKYTNHSVIMIADYYQFQNQSHFSRIFKQATGMTPTAYRKAFKPNTV